MSFSSTQKLHVLLKKRGTFYFNRRKGTFHLEPWETSSYHSVQITRFFICLWRTRNIQLRACECYHWGFQQPQHIMGLPSEQWKWRSSRGIDRGTTSRPNPWCQAPSLLQQLSLEKRLQPRLGFYKWPNNMSMQKASPRANTTLTTQTNHYCHLCCCGSPKGPAEMTLQLPKG